MSFPVMSETHGTLILNVERLQRRFPKTNSTVGCSSQGAIIGRTKRANIRKCHTRYVDRTVYRTSAISTPQRYA